MRAFLTAAVLTLVLGGAPMVAYADDGDTPDTTQADDPGIAALHDAITEMRDANVALRAECPDRSDVKCRAEARKVREAFKEARTKAIEEHHAFKEEQKSAREAAKQKLKDNAKAKGQSKDKKPEASESPKAKPSESARPRPSESPRGDRPAPTPSGSPRI